MKSNGSTPTPHDDAENPSQHSDGLVTLSWQKTAEQNVALSDIPGGNPIYKIAQSNQNDPSYPRAPHTSQERRVTLDLENALNLSSAKGNISLKLMVKHPAKGTLLNVDKLPPGVDVEYDPHMGAIILYGPPEAIEAAIRQIQLDLFSSQQSADLILFIKVNTEHQEAALHVHARENANGTFSYHTFRSSGDAYVQEIAQKLFIDSRPIEELYLREKHDFSAEKIVLQTVLPHTSEPLNSGTQSTYEFLAGALPQPSAPVAGPPPVPIPETPPTPPPTPPVAPPSNSGGSSSGGGSPPPPASSVPVFSGLDAAVTINENAPAALLDANLTITDAATTDYDGGFIRITSTGLAEDQLSLASDAIGIGALQVNGSNIEYSVDGTSWIVVGSITSNGVNGANLTIALNVNATPAIAEAIIEHVTYQNTSDNPAVTHTLTVTVDNGDSGGTSTTETLTVTVTPSNDAPVLAIPITDQAALAGSAFSFTYGSGTFTDADSTISYTATLADGSPLPTWLTFDSATRTFSGTPAFSDLGTIGVTVTATDGSASIDDTFDIVISNNLSVSNLTQTDTYIEDTVKDLGNIVVAAPAATITVTLTLTTPSLGSLSTATSGAVTSTYDSITGIWSASGLLADVNTLLAGVQFIPASNSISSASIAVSVTDSVDTATGTITLNATAVNDAPVAAADNYSTNEDTSLTITAASGVLSNDTDPNDSPGHNLSAVLVSNVSHGSLTLSADGSFTYTPTLDYTGTDSFTYRVDDDGGSANGGVSQGNTVTVTLTIGDVDDAPVNIVPSAQALNEDTSKVIAGISVSDSDTTSLTVTLGVANGILTINHTVLGGLAAGQITGNGTNSITLTGTQAEINATLANATGVTYSPTADYTGTDSLTIFTSDGTLSDSDSISLNVSSISDAPTFSGLSASVTYQENTVNATAQVLDASVTFTDIDPESYAGGSLEITLSSGGMEDQLSIRNQGMAVGQIGVSGSNVYFGGALIGLVTSNGEDGNDLTISFNSNSTPAAVKALVENITYLNSSDTPAASRSAMFTISDGTNSVSQTILINVTQEADIFNLTSGSDHFVGGSENDVFQGSGTNLNQLQDTLLGGTGTDTLSITSGTAVFDTATFSDLGGIEEFTFGSDSTHDVVVDDAYFSTNGFAGTTLKMTANATGTQGVNFDASSVLSSHTLSITGGDGDDTLLGGAGADTIYSNGGDDNIDGGGGSDTVYTAIADLNPNDTISGGTGADDWLIISGGAININTTTFSNIGGVERFGFNAENNHSLTLGDSYFSTAGLSGSTVYLTTTATTGNLTLDASGVTTSSNKVNATGNGGNDTLIGGAGNDTLSAGDGTNRLVGGGGADNMTGGSGIDRFAYTAVSESAVVNQDTITGFVSGTDLLDFSSLGLDYLHNNAFTAAPNQIRWDVSGSDVIVQIDTNGDATADSQIVLAGISSLQVSDFTGVNIVSTTFTLTSGNDNFSGGASTDQFQGAAGNLATSDTVRGGAGNDILQITSGVLALNTTTYSNLWGVEEFQLNSVGAHSLTIGNAYYSTTGFVGNNLTVSTTSTTGMTVNASGVSTSTKTINISGSTANDTLTGGAGNDTIAGGAGNDTITGNAGNDSLDGGAGNDSFSYTMTNLTTADTIAGGAGTDTLSITSGTMTMTTGTTYINLSGVETISLASNAAHNVTVTEGYYSSIGFSGTNLTVTTTSTTGITVSGTALTSGSFTLTATGGAGNDTLTGGAGADTLTGGAGNDSLTGGAGNDRFSYSFANLTSADTLIGGAGTADMLYISAGTFNIDPTTLTNMSGVESFYFNNASAHSITLTDSYYTTMGMAGSTVIVNTNSSTGITVNASAITNSAYLVNMTGNTGNDVLRGGAGNDTISISTGNDSVDGGDGNDTITLGSANYLTSADTLGGGMGMDTVSVTGGSTVFTLNTTTMTNVTGIETFTVNRNGAHAVTFNDAYFATAGFSGNSVTFTTNSSTGVNLNASAVTDTSKNVLFTTGSGSDTIVASAGNDRITYSTGNDNISLGTGDDTLLGSGSNIATTDTVTGGTGSDTWQTNGGTISFNSSTFTNFSGIENFALNNNAGHNLTFYDAYYTSSGFAGNTITVTSTSTSAFTINAANVTTASNALQVTGFSANDNFTGGAGNDTLNGGLGNDTIVGGGGDDSLIGDTGTDNLTGGAGYDLISGGAGNDNYIFTLATDSGIGTGNRDIISDFTTGDKISLSAFAGTFTFRAGGAGETNYTGSVSQVAWAQDGLGNTLVYVDSDGNGVTNFEIQLTGNLTLAATDFTL